MELKTIWWKPSSCCTCVNNKIQLFSLQPYRPIVEEVRMLSSRQYYQTVLHTDKKPGFTRKVESINNLTNWNPQNYTGRQIQRFIHCYKIHYWRGAVSLIWKYASNLELICLKAVNIQTRRVHHDKRFTGQESSPDFLKGRHCSYVQSPLLLRREFKDWYWQWGIGF